LIGEGEGKRIAAVGQSEAHVLQLKIDSYRDPRLYAINIVADHLRKSQQPLVPSQLINFGSGAEGGQASMLGALLSLLTTEKLGIDVNPKKPAAAPTAVLQTPAAAQSPAAAQTAPPATPTSGKAGGASA
jgi:hypothetical protein